MDINQISNLGLIILAVFWFLPSLILLIIHGPSSRRIKGFWVISALIFNWLTLFAFTRTYQQQKEANLSDHYIE